MASMRVLLAAMIAFAPGMVGAAAAQPEPGPEPAGDLSWFESATMVSGLSVVVERPDERLTPNRQTTYTIAVGNRGEDPETVTVRVTVPPWMSEANPHDGGELGEGFVDWPVTVAPGEVTIMRLTGAYTSPGLEPPTRVAFTACALETEQTEPIVCGTDIAPLESADSGTHWPRIAGIAAATAAALGTALFLWRRRRHRGAETAPPPDASTIESGDLPAEEGASTIDPAESEAESNAPAAEFEAETAEAEREVLKAEVEVTRIEPERLEIEAAAGAAEPGPLALESSGPPKRSASPG